MGGGGGLEQLHPAGLPGLRACFSHALAGAGEYARNRHALLTSLAAGLEAAMQRFSAWCEGEGRGGFRGKFFLLGEGYGGVALFELLGGEEAVAHGAGEVAAAAGPEADAKAAAAVAELSEVHSKVLAELAAASAATVQPPAPVAPTGSVSELLTDLGLEEFIAAMEAEEVTSLDTLASLSDVDLKELGLNTIGKRKKVLAAVSARGGAGSTAPPLATPAAPSPEQAERLAQLGEALSAADGRIAEAFAARASEAQVAPNSGDKARVTISAERLGPLMMLGAPLPLAQVAITADTALPVPVSNVFHPRDPLAYRIETMISAANAAVPPLRMPHHLRRQKLHLEISSYAKETSAKVKANVSKMAGRAWSVLTGGGGDGGEPEPEAAAPAEAVEAEVQQVECGALNRGARIDLSLQPDARDVLSELARATKAHAAYWSDLDVAFALVCSAYNIRTADVEVRVL